MTPGRSGRPSGSGDSTSITTGAITPSTRCERCSGRAFVGRDRLMDSSGIDVITASLRPLVGLPLSVARRAADLRGFHFGEMLPTRRGNGGAYVLHVQCPWRLENE